MKMPSWWKPWVGAAVVALAAVACEDRVTEVEQPGTPEVPDTPADPDSVGTPTYFEAVTCTVTVAAGEVKCGAPPAGPEAPAGVIMGGQGKYIDIGVSGSAYNPNTQQFSMQVRVRNLIPQPLGTTDGVSLDPQGVRLFIANGPVLLGGTGSVSLVAPDGHGDFTAGMQPFFQYNQVLDPFESSSPRTWSFALPPTVTSFGFTAYLAAAVEFPDGWIDVAPAPFTMAPGASWKFTATVRDVVGDLLFDGPAVQWDISDSMVATLAGDGTATGVRAGTVQVTATSGPRSGSASLTVTGIIRRWKGNLDTDWFRDNNWDGGIEPVAADTVLIPAGRPNYPLLTANVTVNGVIVEDGATLNVGSFNLTNTGDVATGLSGGILATSGRLVLAGIAKTIHGVVPRVQVTGTYSADGNISARAPWQVDLGRITMTGFRLQVVSN